MTFLSLYLVMPMSSPVLTEAAEEIGKPKSQSLNLENLLLPQDPSPKLNR